MARQDSTRTEQARQRTIEYRCARHAKHGNANYSTRSGHARAVKVGE